jgi:hypothetical protein
MAAPVLSLGLCGLMLTSVNPTGRRSCYPT